MPDYKGSFWSLIRTGSVYLLTSYLDNPDTTIVDGKAFIISELGTPAAQRIYADMLVSFNANPALYDQDNSYIISSQGKPPALVVEIDSRTTGNNDVENKPARYAAMGIRETNNNQPEDWHRNLQEIHRGPGPPRRAEPTEIRTDA